MTTAWNHGRFFQLKFFNRLSIKSVTIYRPNESKIYVFNENSNNSISAMMDHPTIERGLPTASVRKYTLCGL